jgi:hypothetical protein
MKIDPRFALGPLSLVLVSVGVLIGDLSDPLVLDVDSKRKKVLAAHVDKQNRPDPFHYTIRNSLSVFFCSLRVLLLCT